MAVDRTATARRSAPPSTRRWPASTPSTRPGVRPTTGCPDGCGGRPGPSWWPSGLILLVWQIAVWAHWKPYILQSPATVARQLWELLGTSLFWQACWVTAEQAVIGYLLVLLVGGIVGTAVARVPVLRAGIGSLITGMQTMPSVLWYPLGDHGLRRVAKAIILMMILGAAPAVANGFISGIDQVPPGLLRVGRILGARGLSLERHVVLPAAFPTHPRRDEAGLGVRLARARWPESSSSWSIPSASADARSTRSPRANGRSWCP